VEPHHRFTYARRRSRTLPDERRTDRGRGDQGYFDGTSEFFDEEDEDETGSISFDDDDEEDQDSHATTDDEDDLG